MPTDITIVLPDRPGVGAFVCELLGKAGVNIEGTCGFPHRGETWGVFHLLVEDPAAARRLLDENGIDVATEREVLVTQLENRPGALAEFLKEQGDKGTNIDLIYLATGDRVVIGTDDMHGEIVGAKVSEAKFVR